MGLTQVVNLFSRPPVGLLGREDVKNPNQVPTSYLMTDLLQITDVVKHAVRIRYQHKLHNQI